MRVLPSPRERVGGSDDPFATKHSQQPYRVMVEDIDATDRLHPAINSWAS